MSLRFAVNFFLIFFLLFFLSFKNGSALDPFPNDRDLFESGEETSLLRDLELVRKIDAEISDEMPVLYNYSMVSGYFNMPSARMTKTGMFGIGAAAVKPYNVYGANFQAFDRLEFSLNYRVYRGMVER